MKGLSRAATPGLLFERKLAKGLINPCFLHPDSYPVTNTNTQLLACHIYRNYLASYGGKLKATPANKQFHIITMLEQSSTDVSGDREASGNGPTIEIDQMHPTPPFKLVLPLKG